MMTARPKWCTENKQHDLLLSSCWKRKNVLNVLKMFAELLCVSTPHYSIYQNLFLQTLFLWPQTAGWLLCRSHTPEQRRETSAIQEHPCKRRPSLTSWYFSRAMLVSAASGVSMKISLFFWMFSRIPWNMQTYSQHQHRLATCCICWG